MAVLWTRTTLVSLMEPIVSIVVDFSFLRTVVVIVTLEDVIAGIVVVVIVGIVELCCTVDVTPEEAVVTSGVEELTVTVFMRGIEELIVALVWCCAEVLAVIVKL